MTRRDHDVSPFIFKDFKLKKILINVYKSFSLIIFALKTFIISSKDRLLINYLLNHHI